MNQDIFVIIEYLHGVVADISYIMLAAAHQMVEGMNGRVVAVLLGQNAESLAANLAADQILYIEHPMLADFIPDAYLTVLTGLIDEKRPHIVLFGHTSIGMDIASGLSVRLKLPIVSSCHTIQNDNGIYKFASQVCGGKIMAEGKLGETTTLVTMIPGAFKPELGKSEHPPEITTVAAPELNKFRIAFRQYIEPPTGDVDIAKEQILIAVGRGIQREDNLGLIEDLARLLGGVVCASRPVIDQGWLPTTRLVGKSGKAVKPRLYLALGISGAPEHLEGMADSDMIISINTDPTAPIFEIAQYGVEADLFDLIPAIIEQIQEPDADLGMTA